MGSYIAGGVESVLLDELRFTTSPGASYVLNKDVVRYDPSGSSIYSPSSGQRVCKINITGAANQWINPNSLKLVMEVKNTATTALPLQPIVGAHGFWRRLDVRMGGVQVESISQMNRCQELFLMLSSSQARRKELFMSGGTISSESVDANWHQIPDPIAQGQTKNMCMSILSGLTAQSKFLWPNAAPIEFTFELDDVKANLHVPIVSAAETASSSFQIENMYITADVIEMDSALLNKYVEHLSEGKSLSLGNQDS